MFFTPCKNILSHLVTISEWTMTYGWGDSDSRMRDLDRRCDQDLGFISNTA